MKFKSKKGKPPTGMEMSVTMLMPAELDVEQSKEALLKFFDIVNAASKELGSVWLRIQCSGIPEELEAPLQTAFDQANCRPRLQLVVNNSPSTPNREDAGT